MKATVFHNTDGKIGTVELREKENRIVYSEFDRPVHFATIRNLFDNPIEAISGGTEGDLEITTSTIHDSGTPEHFNVLVSDLHIYNPDYYAEEVEA